MKATSAKAKAKPKAKAGAAKSKAAPVDDNAAKGSKHAASPAASDKQSPNPAPKKRVKGKQPDPPSVPTVAFDKDHAQIIKELQEALI